MTSVHDHLGAYEAIGQNFMVAVCIEGILFGLFTALLVTEIWIRTVKCRTDSGGSRLVQCLPAVLLVLMWLVSVGHIAVSIRRALRVIFWETKVLNITPIYFRLQNANKWDVQAHMSLVGTMIGLGDILVIYRTYIVCERKIKYVAFPILLDIVNVVFTAMAIYGLAHPDIVPFKTAMEWYKPTFPIAFFQNVITTSILGYKSWTQHLAMKEVQTIKRSGTGVSFGYLLRVIIESVAIYPCQVLLIIIFNLVQHPASCMVALFIVPSIGIVLSLLYVRVNIGEATCSRSTVSLPDFVRPISTEETRRDPV